MIKWKILCSLRLPVTNTCVHTMTSRSSRLSSHTPRPPSAPLSLVPSGEAVPWGWNRRREPWGVDTMRCLQHFIVVPFEELLGENDMKMIYPSPSKGFCYDISIVLMKNRVKCPAWEPDSITTIIRSVSVWNLHGFTAVLILLNCPFGAHPLVAHLGTQTKCGSSSEGSNLVQLHDSWDWNHLKFWCIYSTANWWMKPCAYRTNQNHLVWSLVEVVSRPWDQIWKYDHEIHFLGTGQWPFSSSQLGSHFLPSVSSGGSEPCLSFMHWKLGTSFVKDMKEWVSLKSKQPNFPTQKKQLFFQFWGVWSFREGIPKLWDLAATNVKIFSAPYSTKVPPKEMDSFKPASSHDKTLPVSD